MDFTVKRYQALIVALKESGVDFDLRHDVDKMPKNSLRIAQLEFSLGVKATYYFRAVDESWDESIIKEIASMGHRIGYHYESLTTCNGDVELAYRDFCTNLERLRKLVPVDAICMHGSPRSKYDSRDLWKHYDYHALGINHESYLDTDFSKVLYLTDTGRRWDGYKVSVRDKIPEYQEQWDNEGLSFHTTDDIIQALYGQAIGYYHLLITTHPQRWNPMGWQWIKEFILQSIKNPIKRLLFVRNN